MYWHEVPYQSRLIAFGANTQDISFFFHILFTNIWIKENKPITKHLRARKVTGSGFSFFGHGVSREICGPSLDAPTNI